jgi:hypothetical protein
MGAAAYAAKPRAAEAARPASEGTKVKPSSASYERARYPSSRPITRAV